MAAARSSLTAGVASQREDADRHCHKPALSPLPPPRHNDPPIYFTANWANYGHVERVLRHLTTQWKSIDVVESVGVAGKSDPKRTVKYFRLERKKT
nr:5'-nucleotidase SurE-like [Ipomoea batatas]